MAAAPWGSAGILPISWMYIAMMGADGLTEATKFAILNANYIAKRLENYFPTLYRSNGLVAHECILDLRAVQERHRRGRGEAADGLRLSRADDFVARPRHDDGRADRERIEVRTGSFLRRDDCHSRGNHARLNPARRTRQNNLLKNAPHTADMIAADNWNRPYSREQAAFPVPGLRDYKFWPPSAAWTTSMATATRSAPARGWRHTKAEPWLMRTERLKESQETVSGLAAVAGF